MLIIFAPNTVHLLSTVILRCVSKSLYSRNYQNSTVPHLGNLRSLDRQGQLQMSLAYPQAALLVPILIVTPPFKGSKTYLPRLGWCGKCPKLIRRSFFYVYYINENVKIILKSSSICFQPRLGKGKVHQHQTGCALWVNQPRHVQRNWSVPSYVLWEV